MTIYPEGISILCPQFNPKILKKKEKEAKEQYPPYYVVRECVICGNKMVCPKSDTYIVVFCIGSYMKGYTLPLLQRYNECVAISKDKPNFHPIAKTITIHPKKELRSSRIY